MRNLFWKKSFPSHPSHVHLHHGIWAADDQDKQVGDARNRSRRRKLVFSDPKEAPQVQEEEIGRSPHGFVGDQNQDDENIPDHANREDKAEKKFSF